MKKIIVFFVLVAMSNSALARNTIGHHSIAAALSSTIAQEKVSKDIALYFADSKYAKPQKKYGELVVSKKTNAFYKADGDACQIAFLSAIIGLQQAARKRGANAVVNITSYYKRNDFSSKEEFECGAGAIMAGTALKGTIVELWD